MSDEWTKPVKMPEGWQSVLGAESKANFYPPTASLRDGLGVLIMSDAGAYAAFAPREVVLRLLAAEASDRLGWVWAPFQLNPEMPLHMGCGVGEWWFDDGTSGAGTPVEAEPTFRFRMVKASDGLMPYLSPDELLASLHGRFLLEDALREAGQ